MSAAQYHTVIIGAGMSGLAAGIRLAYYDQPVCILERHTTIGGLNSIYRLRGRNYDVGLHAVTNYAPPGTRRGPLAKLLKQLRLRWDDFDLTPQIESSVVFPGHTLRFNNDFEFLREQIAQEFPDQADNFSRLVDRIDSFNELDLQQQAVSARSIVAEEINDPVLADMLFCPLMFYGSAVPDDMDFSQFVIMFKAIFQEGFARPAGGVRRILKALTRKFKQLGGDLKLRHGVRRINVDRGRVQGVTLDDGREISARHVLSSIGHLETQRLCEGEAVEPSAADCGAISFNEAIFTLDCQPAQLDHTGTIVFYNDSERFHYGPPDEPCDLRSGIVCSPNNFRYGADDPLEEGCLRITALANPEYWMHAPEEKYLSAKERWTERMIESAVRFIPEFRGHVVDTDVFTPRTIRKFTGHINGAVYGAPHKVLSGETQIEDLYLCGTDQGFLGIIGAMLSGITMANNHLLMRT